MFTLGDDNMSGEINASQPTKTQGSVIRRYVLFYVCYVRHVFSGAGLFLCYGFVMVVGVSVSNNY